MNSPTFQISRALPSGSLRCFEAAKDQQRMEQQRLERERLEAVLGADTTGGRYNENPTQTWRILFLTTVTWEGAAHPSAVGASASAGTAGGAGCASGASAPNGATSACPDHVTHGGDQGFHTDLGYLKHF